MLFASWGRVEEEWRRRRSGEKGIIIIIIIIIMSRLGQVKAHRIQQAIGALETENGF